MSRSVFALLREPARRAASTIGVSYVNWKNAETLRRPEWLYRARGVLPRGDLEFREPLLPGADDIALCERLIAAYHRAAEVRAAEPSQGMWSWIFEVRQRALAAALERQDPCVLAELLASMFRQEFMLGLAPGNLVSHSGSRVGRRIWWVKSLDSLQSLAEAVGVVPAENPEQGSLGRAFECGIEALVESLEAQLGYRIAFPNVGAPYGIAAGSRLITVETPEQIYAAERLADAIRLTGTVGRQVVEIGAGYGGMAYWYLQSHPEVERYSIVDLPATNVLHGYFLAKALGPDMVSLYGERQAKVVVLPDSALASVSAPCDVFVNKDSMPEMPEKAMLDYLRWANANCRGVFYSYNQESSAQFAGQPQNIVSVAMRQFSDFRLIRRDASWLRRGYIEEIYAQRTRGP